MGGQGQAIGQGSVKGSAVLVQGRRRWEGRANGRTVPMTGRACGEGCKVEGCFGRGERGEGGGAMLRGGQGPAGMGARQVEQWGK